MHIYSPNMNENSITIVQPLQQVINLTRTSQKIIDKYVINIVQIKRYKCDLVLFIRSKLVVNLKK